MCGIVELFRFRWESEFSTLFLSFQIPMSWFENRVTVWTNEQVEGWVGGTFTSNARSCETDSENCDREQIASCRRCVADVALLSYSMLTVGRHSSAQMNTLLHSSQNWWMLFSVGVTVLNSQRSARWAQHSILFSLLFVANEWWWVDRWPTCLRDLWFEFSDDYKNWSDKWQWVRSISSISSPRWRC